MTRWGMWVLAWKIIAGGLVLVLILGSISIIGQSGRLGGLTGLYAGVLLVLGIVAGIATPTGSTRHEWLHEHRERQVVRPKRVRMTKKDRMALRKEQSRLELQHQIDLTERKLQVGKYNPNN